MAEFSNALVNKFKEDGIGIDGRLTDKILSGDPETIKKIIALKVPKEKTEDYLKLLKPKIPENKRYFRTQIGEGSFAKVYHVVDREKRIQDVKKELKGTFTKEELSKVVESEINTLKRLSNYRFDPDTKKETIKYHKNIVGYRGNEITEVKPGVYTVKIAMEWLNGLDLRTLMPFEARNAKEREKIEETRICSLIGYPWTPRQAAVFAAEAIDAIAQHKIHGIVHTDLKPENIRFFKRKDRLYGVKFTDYGDSKTLDVQRGQSLTKVKGTAEYIAAQQITIAKQQEKHTTDLAITGRILFELVTGKQLYPLKPSTRAGWGNVGECFDRIEKGIPYKKVREMLPEAKNYAEDGLYHMIAKLIQSADVKEVKGQTTTEGFPVKIPRNKGYKEGNDIGEIRYDLKQILSFYNPNHLDTSLGTKQTNELNAQVLTEVVRNNSFLGYDAFSSLFSDEKRKV